MPPPLAGADVAKRGMRAAGDMFPKFEALEGWNGLAVDPCLEIAKR